MSICEILKKKLKICLTCPAEGRTLYIFLAKRKITIKFNNKSPTLRIATMNRKLRQKLNNLPDRPGVYLFKDNEDRIIYVGKAGSLKRRVGSYFARAGDIKTEKLVSQIFDLETRETPSALEALILEAELIKKYNPKYNIKEKDDRSFLYVGITKEKFPKPVIVRKSEIRNLKLEISFGPFTSAGALREALKILRGIFPWSECYDGQGRPCFYYGIKKCP